MAVNGIITVGEAIDPASLRLQQTAAFPFVPHDTVLPRTAVVVTHAGHGTVMAALAHGVPLVCMPMGRDQYRNAGRITAVGAGVTVEANADPDEIAQAIDRVLGDHTFSDNANRLRVVINSFVEKQAGVVELECLGRTP